MSPSRFVAALAIPALLAAGCGGDGSGPAGPAAASLTLSFPGATLSMGATQPLTAHFYDQFGNELGHVDSVSWSSSNAAIASVDQSGNVRGVSLGGPVTITVSQFGKSATASVTVVPDHIGFTTTDSTVALNTTIQLTGIAVDYFNAPIASVSGPVAWTSSNTSIATVDADGRVTGRAVGDASISASLAGRVGTRHIEVGIPGSHDGTWAGTVTPSGPATYAITISVVFDRVSAYRVIVPPPATNALCPLNPFALSAIPNTHIANDQFAFSVTSPAASISGTFTSATTLAGTESAISFGSVTCPPGSGQGILIANAAAGPFTATKQQ